MKKILVISSLFLFSSGAWSLDFRDSGGSGVSSISTNTTGADGFIFNTPTLQTNSTFYVSSGTVDGFFYVTKEQSGGGGEKTQIELLPSGNSNGQNIIRSRQGASFQLIATRS